ncbi:LppX_LprAFG lipoprotein [Nocardioides sp. GY 10113]|uniref:LppX_LprAFG lipoprotein n=1 Tax=Nocardioides sp. GY 10113 TaxID=2569761 RepID=UPI0014583288|nr:LppX_LprAFG lipoprotein [Nocardioides sp. GY 10113]
MTPLRPTLLAAFLLTSAALTACSGGDEEGSAEKVDTPEQVLLQAKELLDGTSGVEATLSTDEDPGTDYLSEARGTITADPAAFEGTIAGRVLGFPATDISVVSVDGSVWIDVPFSGWTDEYSPQDFCGPDPATLLDPDTGVSGVLTSATDLSAGDSERAEDDPSVVITPYTGTVPGDAIREVLPCTESDDVEATFTIDDEGYLRTADITGAFFPDSDPITYRIAIDAYDVTKDIQAPK